MRVRKNILIVEDEKHLAMGVKYNLEAEGYRVTLVGDGPTAIRLVEADHFAFDLMILDLMLPGMSGYAVCQWVRDHEIALPILILSARSLPEDRARGFDCGANQYLNKPFDLDELLSRVKNLLKLYPQRPQQPAAVSPLNKAKDIAFGKAHINFETYEVQVDQREVKMTHKELQLLRYFVENQGRVISRQELLAEVWDVSGEMQTRSVDQFMLRLRKIFETDPAKPKHFITLRDAGYRFIAEPNLSGTQDGQIVDSVNGDDGQNSVDSQNDDGIASEPQAQ
jgi:two-component system OmpR family response regulator